MWFNIIMQLLWYAISHEISFDMQACLHAWMHAEWTIIRSSKLFNTCYWIWMSFGVIMINIPLKIFIDPLVPTLIYREYPRIIVKTRSGEAFQPPLPWAISLRFRRFYLTLGQQFVFQKLELQELPLSPQMLPSRQTPELWSCPTSGIEPWTSPVKSQLFTTEPFWYYYKDILGHPSHYRLIQQKYCQKIDMAYISV